MSEPRQAPTGPGPLEGIRVVEIAMWVAGPAVGATLADWGADVVKIEPPGGDPYRGLEGVASLGGPGVAHNPSFDVTNRGKRSITVDLKAPKGRDVLLALIDGSDVVVTNLRLGALRRLGLDYDTLAETHPSLVYGLLTAYGRDGPDADAPGYDIGAYWSRAGIAASLQVPGSTPPFQRGAMGDRGAGAMLAGGIAAALLARRRTGQGQLVEQSLYRWGLYTMASDLSMAVQYGRPMATARREAMASPTVNCYRCADDRWVWLIGLERERHFPPLARAVGHPEWLDDPRYATAPARAEHAKELVAELDREFGSHDRAWWVDTLTDHDVWHEPINTIPEVLDDPQLMFSGALVEVPDDVSSTMMVNGPVDFGTTRVGPRTAAPAVGAHAADVLLQAGMDTETVTELLEGGIVG